MAFVCIRVFGQLNLSDVLVRLADDRAARRRSSKARVAVERAVQTIGRSDNMGSLWSSCAPALRRLGITEAMLHVDGTSLRWERRDSASPAGDIEDQWHGTLHLRHNGDTIGRLELRTRGRQDILLPDTPMLAQQLTRAMSARCAQMAVKDETNSPPEPGHTAVPITVQHEVHQA
jgi:hypothetical protein